MRDKRGRFLKNDKLEIPIPSIFTILKYSMFLIILLPRLYVLAFRFEILKVIEEVMEYLFNIPKENNGKTPY